MEKNHFLFLVKNYTSLSQEEAAELTSIKETYPYSQLLHNVCSRAARDLNLDTKDALLHASAIYTTERSVLKSVMTALRSERPEEETLVVTEATEVRDLSMAVEAPATPAQSGLSGEALRNDLTLGLERLKTAMNNFEHTMELLDKGVPSMTHEVLKKKIKKTEETEPTDSLIEEIKSTKKKVKPEGPKQKEQIEIIENFIKTQPTISKNKLSITPTDDSDLAEKSLLFGDNIVSETLVEILLKQGKKDKAIEVLKKLIWKIPQKKAYFAAQIEELKK